jgi:thioesterase domain-containing protein
MDGEGRPQPDGVAGELWIGGAGLAEGYWRQAEATAARFPLHDAGDGRRRWLRTGDLARRRDDGTLEILGRIDDQVQVRGFRVELGEVEATLEAHPAVRRAAAALDGDRLMAWVEGPARQDDLLRLARRRLPSWMVPSAIGVLDALPLTPSGKVDRRALLAAPPPAAPAARPPEGPEQIALAALWRRVLKTETIDAGRSFAEHGGHSLDALTASALAPEVLGRTLSATELLDGATLADLAERRKTMTPSPDGADLLLLPGIGGEGLVLRPLAARLDRLRVRLGDLPRCPDVGEMADRLLAEIPTAPILGGWSMGGVVAFAIALRRTRRGDAPAGVVLLDSFPAAALPGLPTGDDLSTWLWEVHGKRTKTAKAAARILTELSLDEAAAAPMIERWRQARTAFSAYTPDAPLTCPVAVIRAAASLAAGSDCAAAWRPFAAGRFAAFEAPGDHFSMLDKAATAKALLAATDWIKSP